MIQWQKKILNVLLFYWRFRNCTTKPKIIDWNACKWLCKSYFQFSQSLSHTMRNYTSHSVHFKTHMQEEVPVRQRQCCNAPQPSKSPLFESIHPISSFNSPWCCQEYLDQDCSQLKSFSSWNYRCSWILRFHMESYIN